MIFTEDRVLKQLDAVGEALATEEFDVVLPDLERFFGTLASSPYLDREVLWRIGGIIGTSRHASSFVDRRVCAWMAAGALRDRLTIAAAFLTGYWRVAPAVDAAAVAALLALLPLQPRGADANIAVLEALAQLFLAKRRPIGAVERRQIREALLPELEALRASGLHRGTASLLAFVERDRSE